MVEAAEVTPYRAVGMGSLADPTKFTSLALPGMNFQVYIVVSERDMAKSLA